MLTFLKLYGVSFVIFFAIDLLWLGIIAKKIYQNQIGHLLKTDVNWVAAIIFYLLFIGGLVIFVLMPAVEKGSIVQALYMGALFGLLTYATYDLTNLATLKDWPLQITFIDLAWGTFLGASTSTISYFLFNLIF
ncbi:MAG: hypothetical protein A2009_00080 [Tenericutes bacterium GWD2_38_27]|nr:MAG: hypothetical protein A2Y43_01285 [Tenericutes bacterium GWA2_38_26]OHE32034.1 MAG: hypothetical protein A2009_00080 [Tenericutes bacterium GWD2_38_27]HBG32797.1 DUF2177 domain-containing protein [Acholeplasmataceae bacterium]HCB66632.1 DUF2177 domain-containing protein [Acholeplasmataceae bacterium]